MSPLLSIYPKETKPLSLRDTCASMFTAEQVTKAKKWKQPKWPSMDETRCVCVYTHTHTHTNGILFNPKKKKEFLSFVTICMNLEGTMLNGMSDKEKQVFHWIIYMWNFIFKSCIHRNRE